MSASLVFRPRCTGLPAALAALCMALGSAAAEPATAASASSLRRAQELFDAGRLYPAEQAVREAIEREPDLVEAHRLLGRILLRRRKPAEAAAAFERAAALAPAARGLERELAFARFEAGDYAGARESILQALALDPDDPELRLRLGRCELELGHPERAAREFERAAQHPGYRQVALYNLGVALERAGRKDEAREALGRAVADGTFDPLSERAWRRMQALEPRGEDRPWRIGLAAGAFYDSNILREEVDRQSGEPDGAGQLEFDASYALPVREWFELDVGYGLYQSLHFDADEFDLQSHSFHTAASRRLGSVDTSLGYLYSLNTLGGSRFLDFHQLRPAVGVLPRPWWYVSLAPALRVKRFEDAPERDAEQGALGVLQIFSLGHRERRLLVGIEGQLEDADSRAFDYRGVSTQAGLRLPFALGERLHALDLSYRYRRRDYTDPSSIPLDPDADPMTPNRSGRRIDRIHSARVRLEVPLVRHVSLHAGYEFEDATSDVRSADYTDHTVLGLLRFDL